MLGNTIRLAALLALVTCGLPGPVALADEAEDAARYRDCMALIDTHPEAAFDKAVEWKGFGGGAPAEHCAGAALLVLGYYREAATRLEELGQQPLLEPGLKANLFRQAAQGWLLANEPERAFAVLTAAIDIRPEDAGLWLDRGAVLGEMALYDDAVEDLSRALTLSPMNADAWAFRGSAHRFLDQNGAALSDLNEAIRLAPNHIEAYLERGNVKRLMGDDQGARDDWITVIELAPDTEAADDAQTNIERMDGGIQEPAGESQ